MLNDEMRTALAKEIAYLVFELQDRQPVIGFSSDMDEDGFTALKDAIVKHLGRSPHDFEMRADLAKEIAYLAIKFRDRQPIIIISSDMEDDERTALKDALVEHLRHTFRGFVKP